MNRNDIIKAAGELAEHLETVGDTPLLEGCAAMLRSLIALVPKEGMVVVPEEVVNFLHGAGPLDGCHFGEKPPKERGQYWWRKHLPPIKVAKEGK